MPASSSYSTDPPPSRELSEAELELVRIHGAMRADFHACYTFMPEPTNTAECEKRLAKDPALNYVPQFVDFELRHHGTHAGLMAARQVLLLAGGWFEPSDTREFARRRILSVLGDYVPAPELLEMLGHLAHGMPEPMCETVLRQMASSKEWGERSRACAGYLFAQWCEAMDVREWLEERLDELDGRTGPEIPWERASLERRRAAVPPPLKIAALKTEAVEVLESLSNCPPDLRQPCAVGIDHEGAIVECSSTPPEWPTIRDLAAGLLFKMRRLNVGNKAPDLQLNLVDGKKWSLAEQAGKVVVIQFAHKGCRPCEQEYPALRSLIREYGEKVEVLSIMGDPRREDATKAVESGKLTWSVYWDGLPGPIGTKWAVTGVPTEYVVAPDGRIAGHHLRGESLKARVAELVQ